MDLHSPIEECSHCLVRIFACAGRGLEILHAMFGCEGLPFLFADGAAREVNLVRTQHHDWMLVAPVGLREGAAVASSLFYPIIQVRERLPVRHVVHKEDAAGVCVELDTNILELLPSRRVEEVDLDIQPM